MHRYCEPPMPDVPIEQQEVKNNNHATSKAIEFVVHHPLRELRLWVPRMRYAYRHDHDAMDDVGWFITGSSARALSRAADSFYFGVLTLAAVGMWPFARPAEPRRLLFLLTTVSLAVTPILLFGAPRYKVPAMPLLTMVAAAGAVTIVDRVRGGGLRPRRARPATARRAAAR